MTETSSFNFFKENFAKMFSREHEKQQKDFSQKLLILDAGGGGGSIYEEIRYILTSGHI